MRKQIRDQWIKAFGASGAASDEEVQAAYSQDDLTEQEELAALMQQIELRENGPATSAPANQN
jgi:hypothetical protein